MIYSAPNKKINDVFVKRAIGILAGVIIFMGITQIFNEMYVGCFEYSDVWHPVLWQQFYKDKEIDNLYLEMYDYLNQVDQGLGDYHREWHNADYMTWSFNKAAYMLAIGGANQKSMCCI